jgi:glycosyltransferase involved in cell wall biosynthesis
MKIALVCDWYLPRVGGLEMQMRDLARELVVRGHEVHVITATPAAANTRLGMHGVEEANGVRVHRLDVALAPKLNTIRSTKALAPLEAIMRRERFDVVHCHTALSPLAHGGAYVARRLGIPSVLTEHSVLKGAGAMVLRAMDTLYGWSEWPTVLTAVSTYVARELAAVTGRPLEEVHVLPNGVNHKEWHQARPGDDRQVRVVSTMRLTKRKRPVDIVRAIPRVHARLRDGEPRPIFTLVGGGPEEARVRREAKRLGVEEHLEVLGWRPRPEVKQALASSSVFVLPTSKEALSIATLEALSAGLPVVAMNHGGVGDIVEDGREGFLVADSDEFVERIVELVRDATLRQRMAEAGRARVAKFGWDAVIARHLDIYGKAMGREDLGAAVAAAAAALQPSPAWYPATRVA